LCWIGGVHADAARSKTESELANRQSHAATFAKVVNGRKPPVRGLWRRGERFYAQLTVEDPSTGQKKVRRVSLCNAEGEPVQTVAQAIEEMHRLKVKRAEDDLPKLGRTPGFSAYTDDDLNFIKSGSGMKNPDDRGTGIRTWGWIVFSWFGQSSERAPSSIFTDSPA
jgi:hypothetical protein